MIFKDRKYVMSNGVMFYPEYEITRLKKEAHEGWTLDRVSRTGLLIFKRGTPRDSQFAIDFYDGDKSSIPDYLSLYEEAGWKNIYTYKNKYFYFEASLEATPIYSDPQSYRDRIHKEWVWGIMRSFLTLPVGLVFIYLLIMSKNEVGTNLSAEWTRFFLYFIGFFFTFWPIGIIVNVLFARVMYGKRIEFYKNPEVFAKKQRKLRDVILLMLLGGFLGGSISVIVTHLFRELF
ncbi:hypothetical protein IGI37_002497 [Enterococcus sp. AZ194]|uniref:DUF2812 domain-containing protein n=1 Tax=Enterococcus sp. AZ194 TaxID=2774629 RepID=UPI003F289CA9